MHINSILTISACSLNNSSVDVYYISEAVFLFEHNFEIVMEINRTIWLKTQVFYQMYIFLECICGHVVQHSTLLLRGWRRSYASSKYVLDQVKLVDIVG